LFGVVCCWCLGFVGGGVGGGVGWGGGGGVWGSDLGAHAARLTGTRAAQTVAVRAVKKRPPEHLSGGWLSSPPFSIFSGIFIYTHVGYHVHPICIPQSRWLARWQEIQTAAEAPAETDDPAAPVLLACLPSR